MENKQQTFRRWAVVNEHDRSPVDGQIFVHKHLADKFACRKPNTYRVVRVEIKEAE